MRDKKNIFLGTISWSMILFILLYFADAPVWVATLSGAVFFILLQIAVALESIVISLKELNNRDE
jgi:hypothetical protein